MYEFIDLSTSLYLDNDDQTWQPISALFRQLHSDSKTHALLGVPLPQSTSGFRALSIKEWARLKYKHDDRNILLQSEPHESDLWKHWHKTGFNTEKSPPTLPIGALSYLLRLLNAYTPDQCLGKFQKVLSRLNTLMMHVPLQEAYDFYTLRVARGETSRLMLEILIDCWQGRLDLKPQLIAVAQWLHDFNPAFISKNPWITPAYALRKAGPYFDVSALLHEVSALNPGELLVLTLPLQDLVHQIRQSDRIQPAFIVALEKIYQTRWEACRDTPQDYLRLQDGINTEWIRLAQHLAGAQWIDRNYLRLLMPTLTHDNERLLGEPLMFFPLPSFLLDESNEHLIYLPHCVTHFKTHGTFYKLIPQAVELTPKEKQRMPYTATAFLQAFLTFENTPTVGHLSKKTLTFLIEFINHSLYPEGLLCGGTYDEIQMLEAKQACQRLYYRLHVLSKEDPSEYSRLYKQQICLNGIQRSFEEILKAIAQDECIASAGCYVIKLILDYAPQTEFTPSIEKKLKLRLESMRLSSQHKPYNLDPVCPYPELSDEEITRRVLTLYVFLMTHTFKVIRFTGMVLSGFGYENTTSNTGYALFEQIHPILPYGKGGDFRKIYAGILEKIINPALRHPSLKTALTRSSDTNNWLMRIANGKLFQPTFTPCFEPYHLISTLRRYCSRKPETARKVTMLLNQIIKSSQQSETKTMKWVHVNMTWCAFLNKAKSSLQKELLASLLNPGKSQPSTPPQSPPLPKTPPQLRGKWHFFPNNQESSNESPSFKRVF